MARKLTNSLEQKLDDYKWLHPVVQCYIYTESTWISDVFLWPTLEDQSDDVDALDEIQLLVHTINVSNSSEDVNYMHVQ